VGADTAAPRPRIWHALLLLPLVAVVVWVAARGRVNREDPADVLKHLKTAQAPTLPAAKAAGASERSALEQYDRETLYDYIDGAAEAFIARGFERCTVATYTIAGVGAGLEVSAEVYRFAAADGARQQLEADRPSAVKPQAQLPAALTDGNVLLLASGRDLLKLTSLGRGVDAAPALVAIAAAWQKDQPR
jgi:hypothetical protein